jgi:hypothetical protein
MRIALLLSMALVAAPMALAQQTADKSAQAAKSAATSPARPAAKAVEKATKAESVAAVRSTPADFKKIEGKSYEGCGHGGKMSAANDL